MKKAWLCCVIPRRTPGGGTDLAAMLGKEETLARLRAALAALG